MAFRWMKGLALPLTMLTLLAACQPGPRNYARTAPQTSYASQSSYYGGYGPCGVHPCATPRHCPPGYVLGRIPISLGGPGRYCRPHYTRGCCGPPRPPICLGQGGPCNQGGYPAY